MQNLSCLAIILFKRIVLNLTDIPYDTTQSPRSGYIITKVYFIIIVIICLFRAEVLVQFNLEVTENLIQWNLYQADTLGTLAIVCLIQGVP